MANSIFVNPDTDAGSPSTSIIPTIDNTYDLGSASFEWRTAYLGTSLVLADAATISWSDVVLSRASANLLQLASGDSFQTVAGTITANRTALVTTSTDGLVAANTTAATGAVTVQISPRLKLRGNAWDTAASQTVDYFLETLPATAATPTGTLRVGYSLNGAAATFPLLLTGSRSTFLGQIFTGDNIEVPASSFYSFTSLSRIYSPGNGQLNLTLLNTTGTGLDVTTAGTLKVRTTAHTGYGTVDALGYQMSGIPTWVVKATRVTAQSAANASIATYTVGAADGSFEVSANMNVTVVTTLVTTLTVTYTDEASAARTMVLPVTQLSGSFIAAGAITGLGAWETPVMHIRCKTATVITILTSAGTFTGVTYSAEGIIKQMA